MKQINGNKKWTFQRDNHVAQQTVDVVACGIAAISALVLFVLPYSCVKCYNDAFIAEEQSRSTYIMQDSCKHMKIINYTH